MKTHIKKRINKLTVRALVLKNRAKEEVVGFINDTAGVHEHTDNGAYVAFGLAVVAGSAAFIINLLNKQFFPTLGTSIMNLFNYGS